MQIRKATSEDFEIINRLAIATWHDAYKEILSVEQLHYMLEMMYSKNAITEQILIKGHRFLLLYEGDNYLGFASYELNYLSETTKLHKLYVLPETQGRGAGKLLMAKIEKAAAANGNNRISLNVNRYNSAVQFYAKNGYVKVREEDINIGNGYLMEDFIMEKGL
ncbi:GNAT family N-acetyltransferase [Flavobacterium sp. DG1-102-2]|uniref:GNAT family N-acetyltransferase n=1 Tax=Flavobacterium sp. DG1-102-2 TaxID=3081663 RepID=UPI00294A56AF|nr:GNAT family N-acetyltransferase [Flavobacterium sp. DG1-102-2]MDV6168176.1 GNAT family N-acetyltransferase [Flavobacterium sp. DG1-102-2]